MVIQKTVAAMCALTIMAGCASSRPPAMPVAQKSQFQIDQERCRAIAQSTQSTPAQVRAMEESIARGTPEKYALAGLEEGRVRECMLATGKYGWMAPSQAEVTRLQDQVVARVRRGEPEPPPPITQRCTYQWLNGNLYVTCTP